MFTGIVTDIGQIVEISERDQGRRFRIETLYDPASIDIGASISCSGICLTVTGKAEQGANRRWFEVEAWEEALRLTTAAAWTKGTRVNLERAMRAGDEFGGHMVSGHIDGKALIVARTAEGEAIRFRLRAPEALARYIAPKGSVALDGVSLTVNTVEGDEFDVLLIRHSLEVTLWKERVAGEEVNLEIDQMARYVERYVKRLAEHGKEA
ncbi:riboflavin synthase [Oricola cellulosilytica]|uniref:Riboflavin synthase n=2 Tax=Oricola cellulosilytica TaxID=1429082 RepID=A0A4R0PD85_9HYPH|nr:riboflavin synthase [Oricola cellulosilytica]